MLLVDQGLLQKKDYFTPFALTDQLILEADRQKETILHFWQLDHAVILGMKDTRLPNLSAGLDYLRKNQYQPIVRNSGGLGVVADEGILNISLIFPQPEKNKLMIDAGYEEMTRLIQQTFSSLGEIIPGEIKASYCPGTFDLSISGQKIAGIAQRRNQSGMAVMLYLSVTKPQGDRGRLMREFYNTSLDEVIDHDYPKILPDSMTSLEEVSGTIWTIEEIKNNLKSQFDRLLDISDIDFSEQSHYSARLENMKKRNEGIL